MKSNRAYLERIRESLECIALFTGNGPEEFLEDRKTRSAVLRELQVLTESCRGLSPSLTANHPEVLWQGIAGFRQVLIRDYLGIKPERVWAVIEDDLPVLRHAVAAMLGETADAH
jgi:uncharacterized protein with HEPN domain